MKTEFKAGDLVWMPSKNTFNVVEEVEKDKIKVLFDVKKSLPFNNEEDTNSLKKEENYKLLSEVFERNEEYLNNLILTLQNKNINPREYYEFLRTANEIITNKNSIFFKTLKRAYLDNYSDNSINDNYEKAVKVIENRYSKNVSIDFEKESEKISNFIKKLIESVNVDKIKEIIEFYYQNDFQNISDVLRVIKSLFNINTSIKWIDEKIKNETGINDLKNQIKVVFKDIFLNVLFKKLSKNNFTFLSDLYSDLDFSDFEYKKYAEKINLKEMVSFLGKFRKNYKLIFRDDSLLDDKNKLELFFNEIDNIVISQLLYYVINNSTQQELLKTIDLIVKSMKNASQVLPEKYQKVDKLFEISGLKQYFFYHNGSPVESLKDIYESQDNNLTYGEKLFILNSLFSIGILTNKITPELYKQTIFEVLNILDSKEPKELYGKNLDAKEFYTFIGMYNIYATNAASNVKECSFETAIKAHYLMIEKALEVVEEIEKFDEDKKLKLMTAFKPKYKSFIESKEKEKEEQTKITKKMIKESSKYVNSLLTLAESDKEAIDNIKNIYTSRKEIKSAEKIEMLREDGRDARYILNRKGLYHLVETNIHFLVSLIEENFIEAKKENVMDFKKRVLLNGMKGIIDYFESDNYKPVDTEELIYKGYQSGFDLRNQIFKLEDVTEDYLTKQGIFHFIKNLTLHENESKWLLSLNDYKISLTLLSTGYFFNRKKRQRYYSNEENSINLLNLIDTKELSKLLSEKVPGKFESSLFNYSILFALDNSGAEANNPNIEYELLNTKNFTIDSIIVRNYILYTLSDINNLNYRSFFRNLEGKSNYESFENFFKEADKSFLKSLKKAGENEEYISYLKKILEDLKEVFTFNGEENKIYIFSIPISEPENFKLYQSKMLTPLYSTIKNIFLNGITIYGKKEQEFIKKTFFEEKVVNKWLFKSGLYENVFIKGGLLAVLYKTEGEESLNSLFYSSYGSDNVFNKEDLIASLKNLPKNFAIIPLNIPSSELKKNTSLIAKIIAGERLFGIEKGSNYQGKELVNKIKVSDYNGLLLIKNKMKKNGIIFEKQHKEKGKENGIKR